MNRPQDEEHGRALYHLELTAGEIGALLWELLADFDDPDHPLPVLDGKSALSSAARKLWSQWDGMHQSDYKRLVLRQTH